MIPARSPAPPRLLRLPQLPLLQLAAAALSSLLLAGCAIPTPVAPADAGQRIVALLPADALLLGEQHDAPEHHRIERAAVEALAADGRLAALALEMAEDGQGTGHLGPAASEAQVQAALGWSNEAWPWADYGPAVMAAVKAGVPVLGANLPRARMKDAMVDVSLDAQLDDAAREAQQQAVREGHCNLLPESQIGPMTRIQIARDRSMAQVLIKARQPGKAVLLITGAGHATRALGVPQHLPTDLRVKTVQLALADKPAMGGYDRVWQTPAQPAKDYCAGLRK